MKIESLTVENWKCFSSEMTLDFSDIEIWAMRNGLGKTSVFEAILYATYGKLPYKIESYQNHEGKTKVKLSFSHDGEEYVIKREYPNAKPTVYKNNEEFKKGAAEVFDFMNSLVNYNITKRLWFSGEVSDAEVLDFKFFKDEILSEKLKDPNTLIKHYNSENYSINRQIKNIVIAETRPIEEIDADIKEVNSKLRDKSSFTDFMYTQALAVKSKAEELEEVKEKLKQKNAVPYFPEDIIKWKGIDIENAKRALEEENKKTLDNVLSSLNKSTIQNVLMVNDREGHCAICEGEWTQEQSEKLKNVVAAGLKDINKVAELEEQIEYYNSLDKEIAELSESFHQLNAAVSQMPNYQEVIDERDEENDRLWEKAEQLSRERDVALANNQQAQELKKLENERAENKVKLDVLTQYVKKATAFYTDSLMNEASVKLQEMNPRYSYMSISGEDNQIIVCADGEPRYVTQLSRGEKTLVALSLITTIRDLFTPGLPLIFDESFSALDEENSNAVISILKDSFEQLFVITHSSAWLDYGEYDKDRTIVRTYW